MNFNSKTYSEVKTTFGSVVSEQTEQTGEKCKCRSGDVTLTPQFLQFGCFCHKKGTESPSTQVFKCCLWRNIDTVSMSMLRQNEVVFFGNIFIYIPSIYGQSMLNNSRP